MVLDDHKRNKKRLIPPMVATCGPFREVSWANAVLPEIVWLAVLTDFHGPERGRTLALSVVQAASDCLGEDARLFFGSATSFSCLTTLQKEEVRESLAQQKSIIPVSEALHALVALYPECPLSGVISSTRTKDGHDLEKWIANFKLLVSSNLDKHSRPAILLQALVVELAFRTQRLFVCASASEGARCLPSIEEYPESEASQVAAGFVRGSVPILVAPHNTKVPSDWALYFWNRGLELTACEPQN